MSDRMYIKAATKIEQFVDSSKISRTDMERGRAQSAYNIEP